MAQRPDSLTPTTAPELFGALRAAWRQLLGADSPRCALVLLVAQSAMECGWWHACHCWNLGNEKASPAGSKDFTYYGCDENLTTTQAQHAISIDPAHCHVESQNAAGCLVWFDPPHPYACFAAYASLEDGALAWLTLQHGRFGHAWAPLLAGDPRAFAVALHEVGYFTAPVDRYATTLASIFASLDKSLPQLGDDAGAAALAQGALLQAGLELDVHERDTLPPASS